MNEKQAIDFVFYKRGCPAYYKCPCGESFRYKANYLIHIKKCPFKPLGSPTIKDNHSDASLQALGGSRDI